MSNVTTNVPDPVPVTASISASRARNARTWEKFRWSPYVPDPRHRKTTVLGLCRSRKASAKALRSHHKSGERVGVRTRDPRRSGQGAFSAFRLSIASRLPGTEHLDLGNVSAAAWIRSPLRCLGRHVRCDTVLRRTCCVRRVMRIAPSAGNRRRDSGSAWFGLPEQPNPHSIPIVVARQRSRKPTAAGAILSLPPSVRYQAAGQAPEVAPYPARARMLDLIFIAAGTAFFLLTAAYAVACDRL